MCAVSSPSSSGICKNAKMHGLVEKYYHRHRRLPVHINTPLIVIQSSEKNRIPHILLEVGTCHVTLLILHTINWRRDEKAWLIDRWDSDRKEGRVPSSSCPPSHAQARPPSPLPPSPSLPPAASISSTQPATVTLFFQPQPPASPSRGSAKAMWNNN